MRTKSNDITRRAILGSGVMLAVGTALTATTVATSGAVAAEDAPAPEGTEPLLRMINAYRAALDEFNRTCPAESSNDVWLTYAETTWLPFFYELENWDMPATTMEGAVAALRCAFLEERDNGNSDITLPLMTAAMGYFDRSPTG